MIYALFPSTTKNLKAASKAVKESGHKLAVFGFQEEPSEASIFAPNVTSERDAMAFFEARQLVARHAYLKGGKLTSRAMRKDEATAEASRDDANGKGDTRPLKVGAFAVCCGGKLIHEIETVLTSLQRWHPDFPIYLLTDKGGEEMATDWIEEYGLGSNIVIDVISEEERFELVSGASVATKSGTSWDESWIAAKILSLQRAISTFGCGVLLVDSDITLTRELSPLEWNADLVLSPASGAHPDRMGRFNEHFYNAGMLACADPEIADEWMRLYLAGEGGHYEEGCLSILSRKLATDHFPTSWNVGRWQHEALPITRKQTPAAIHIHLSDTSPTSGNPFELIELARHYSDEARDSLMGRKGAIKGVNKESFAVVTSFFNFAGFVRPLQNARRFVRQMKAQGLDFYGIELVIGDADPAFANSSDWITVRAGEDGFLWQKETLLNHLIKSLPSKINYVASLDCDIEFADLNWSEKLLSRFAEGDKVLQPFTDIVKTERDGSLTQSIKSVRSREGEEGCFGNPGLGWSFCRDWFESVGGFYPFCVLGGGDTAFANSITGIDPNQSSHLFREVGPLNKEIYLKYANTVKESLPDYHLCPLEGSVFHEWHGTIENRDYRGRNKITRGFDALNHVERVGSYLRWTDRAPSKLKDDVKAYFRNRREDG